MSNATHRSTPSFAVVVERKCNAYFPDIPTSIWEKGSKSSAYHAFVKFRLRILKTAITVAVLTDFWDPKHAVIGVVFIKITYGPELCANRGDIKFVEKMLAAAAMQYMDEVGTSVAAGYKLDRLTPAERMIRVGELLCEYSWLEDNDYRTRKYPFAGEAMIGAIGSCYAWTDRECRIGEINRQVILLTATGLYHGLKALISGVYVADPKELDTYRESFYLVGLHYDSQCELLRWVEEDLIRVVKRRTACGVVIISLMGADAVSRALGPGPGHQRRA